MSLIRHIIPSSQIHMNIHLPCYCTSHLPVGLHVCHRAPFFEWKRIRPDLLSFVYIYNCKSSYQREWYPNKPFSPVTLVCLSQRHVSWSLFMFSEFIWQVVVRFYRYWWNCWPSHISTISGKKRQPYCRKFLWRHIFSDLFKNVLIIRLTWQVYYKRQELLLSSVLRCLLRF